jgi:hypothetical protein
MRVAIQLGALFKSLIYMVGFIPLLLKFSKSAKKILVFFIPFLLPEVCDQRRGYE